MFQCNFLGIHFQKFSDANKTILGCDYSSQMQIATFKHYLYLRHLRLQLV